MFTENSPYDPKSPYSAAKASADHLVMAYHNTFGLHTTISHCGNNFGPRQYPEKLIPLAINRLLDGQKVPVYGTGKNIRDWIYVKDHCEAISRIIMDGKSGERYCVSGRNEMTNLEIVSQIVKLLGKDFNDSVNYVKDRAGHDFRYAISDEKIKTELGFMPAYQFKETLAHTVQWYIYEHNAKRNKLMVETYKMI
jgi:dTDP-glucose 4,6-dehydratase